MLLAALCGCAVKRQVPAEAVLAGPQGSPAPAPAPAPAPEPRPFAVTDGQPNGLSGQLPNQDVTLPEVAPGQELYATEAQLHELREQLKKSELERKRLAKELKGERRGASDEIDQLRKDKLDLTLENQRLRESNLTLNLNIQRLQQQIQALEELHLEINRKKKVVE